MAWKSKTKRSKSPIDDHQEELSVQERQLREQMRQLELLIEEGPKLAAEERRRRREEMIERANHAGSLEMPSSISARKYEFNVNTSTVSRPRLRAEQRAQRITFLLLLVTLSLLVFFLISQIGG